MGVWPQVSQHALAAVPEGERVRLVPPDAARISRMEEAFGWLALIPPHRTALQRIVAYRALVSPAKNFPLFSWRLIGKRLGVDHRLAQRMHAMAIGLIVAGLRERAASTAGALPLGAAEKVARPAVAAAARGEVVNSRLAVAGPS